MKLIVQYFFVFLTFIASGMLMTTAAYWVLIDVENPITSVSVQLKDASGTPTDVFRRGEIMLVNRKNCTTRDVNLVVTSSLIRGDGVGYVLDPGLYIMENGCEITERGILIPPYVVPGKYEYWVTVAYQNNPLMRGQVLLKVPTLEVVP